VSCILLAENHVNRPRAMKKLELGGVNFGLGKTTVPLGLEGGYVVAGKEGEGRLSPKKDYECK